MNIGTAHSSRAVRARFRAGLAAAAVGATVLAGGAACTGSSTPVAAGTTAASTSPSAASTSPSAAGTVSPPVASASTTGAVSTTTEASAACGNADIAVTSGRSGIAMNHIGRTVVFENVSSRTCTLQGYPGASVAGGGTSLVDADRVLNGYIGDMRRLSSMPLVTLQPGQSASAEIEWAGNAGEKCYADGSGSLVVTPPNTTKPTTLFTVTVGTRGMCAGFEVHPVVAGIISG